MELIKLWAVQIISKFSPNILIYFYGCLSSLSNVRLPHPMCFQGRFHLIVLEKGIRCGKTAGISSYMKPWSYFSCLLHSSFSNRGQPALSSNSYS